MFIFYMPIWIFQDNHVLITDGANADIWTLSLTSFTCLYIVVTGKLVIWTRWWTNVSFFFYIVMSVFVYILYMWFSHFWEESLVRYSVVQLHKSPLFWLTMLLVGGTAFCGDLAIEFFRMRYFKNGSDYVREFLTKKTGWYVDH